MYCEGGCQRSVTICDSGCNGFRSSTPALGHDRRVNVACHDRALCTTALCCMAGVVVSKKQQLQ